MDPFTWGSTEAERRRAYPCDELIPEPEFPLWRAVTIRAPVSTVFRWLCQLRIAPYSYDWIDNLGRPSPRRLIPGLDQLEVGQRFMIFTLDTWSHDQHVTMSLHPGRGRRLFGHLAITYWLDAIDPCTRLVVKLAWTPRWPWLGWFLAIGDWIMMRKQLLTFKALAEGDLTNRFGR